MEAVLAYMYYDREPDQSIAGKVLVVADRYQMQHLDQVCQRVLYNSLTNENAAEIALLTDKYPHCSELRSLVIDYIVANLDDILQREQFHTLMHKCPSLAAE